MVKEVQCTLSLCGMKNGNTKGDFRATELSNGKARNLCRSIEWAAMSQMVRISIMINHPGSTQRQTRPVRRSDREISPSGVYLVPSISYKGPVYILCCALQSIGRFKILCGLHAWRNPLEKCPQEHVFLRSGGLELASRLNSFNISQRNDISCIFPISLKKIRWPVDSNICEW